MKDNSAQNNSSIVPLTIPGTALDPWNAKRHPVPLNPPLPPPNAALPGPWGPMPFAPNPHHPAPWRPEPFGPIPHQPAPWDLGPKPWIPLVPPYGGPPTSGTVPALELYPSVKVEEHALYKKISKAIGKIEKRAKKKETKRTHIVFVLDKSASMDKGKDITLSGFNEQVDIVQQRKKGAGRTTVSLVLFNNEAQVSYAYKNTSTLAKLTDTSYKPGGLTALYDAIGRALELVVEGRGFKEKNTAFFVAIFTDGGENISRICPGPVISKCMALLEETGRVTFSFMGPNSGLKSITDVLKVNTGNAAGYDPESLLSRSMAFTSMSNATRSYLSARSEGATAVCNLYTGAEKE
jgi:uncharacterized protein YegL